jgi:hypothetical protein
MMAGDAQSTSGQMPSIQVRSVVSFLIAKHFLAVSPAVLSAGNRRFNAPSLAVRFVTPFRPYLQFLFMSASYRLFAPNPDPTKKLYVRIVRLDGSVRWVE